MILRYNSNSSVSATSDENRGSIMYLDRAKQIHEFKGLRYKNITPTDIDGYFEIRDKIFILFEIKKVDKEIEKGQRMALERFCDNIHKPAIVILAEHDTPVEEIVDAASCTVRSIYIKGKNNVPGKWQTPKTKKTLRWVIDWYLEKHGFADYVKSPGDNTPSVNDCSALDDVEDRPF